MGGAGQAVTGPDFAEGVALASLAEGEPLLGHVGDDPVLLTRFGDDVFAVGAGCTHYGGPLADGATRGETVVCPWHHACFSLRTGEALEAPALNPLPRWQVEVSEGRATLGAPLDDGPLSARGRTASAPEPVVIVGAGAAGSAAAEMLRREGYGGRIVLIDPEPDAPYDRPNLSKDYLDGSAPAEWIPLRPPTFYEDHGVERVRGRAVALDTAGRRVHTDTGDAVEYGALLIASGATPRTLPVPGADGAHVRTLRSLADAQAIIAAAESAERAVVVGASFIGMEVAMSLKKRGLDVTVVAPEDVPFERVLGAELGRVLAAHHERNGITLRMGAGVARIESNGVVLDDDTHLPADLAVVGIGVVPATGLAQEAGLEVDDGIVVDERLRTSAPNVWAAGDVARVRDAERGTDRRVEHWVVAQRQGQAAARSILGADRPHRDVPFFWTVHFDVAVGYVGHATAWDSVDIDGDPGAGDAAFRYIKDGETVAVATIGRDAELLRAEEELAP